MGVSLPDESPNSHIFLFTCGRYEKIPLFGVDGGNVSEGQEWELLICVSTLQGGVGSVGFQGTEESERIIILLSPPSRFYTVGGGSLRN